MIAPINSGQQNNIRPWMIPDDAFESLVNAYIFRGRVRKRCGSRPLNTIVDEEERQRYTRLRVEIGTTDPGTGNFTIVAPGVVFKRGQMFSIGDTVFTVYQTVGDMYTTGAATGTYDTSNGNLVITGNGENPLTTVWFYPAEPVMGFTNYDDTNINAEPTYAFDTQFAYLFNGAAWQRAGTAAWTGSDTNFFWSCNWRGVDANDFILFTTNFHTADGIKYWNNITWTKLTPTLTFDGWSLESCRCIVSWKGRLICLNTVESDLYGDMSNFVARARWCKNGTPLVASDVDAWRQDIAGKGGFVDAATMEQIVSCSFVKDRLIVYFERSTWELISTGNDAVPFYWQRINEELGCESTFSVVPFDKEVFGVGLNGIHSCNGVNVDRIDQKIPDQVFEISNFNGGPLRVCGIRDYYTQLVYWAYPNLLADSYPNKLLVYNYLNGSWSTFGDSITAFGYYNLNSGLTWGSWNITWAESNWQWQSGQNQEGFRAVIAGNQQGFTFIIDQDITVNAMSLQITDIAVGADGWHTLTIEAHNLSNSDYIQIKNMSGTTGINNKIYDVTYVDTTHIKIYEEDYAGTYAGGGTILRVSDINILTKQYNFYVQEGRDAYISKVDFYVDKTVGGEISVDYGLGASNYKLVNNALNTGAWMGSGGILETKPYDLIPFEAQQDQLWHPTYPQAEGQSIQLRLYLSDEQMRDPNIVVSDFQLHAMTFYVTPTTSRMQ